MWSKRPANIYLAIIDKQRHNSIKQYTLETPNNNINQVV